MLISDSDRLTIRTWTPDDLEHAIKLWGNPDVMAYIDVRGGLRREQVLAKLELEFGYQRDFGVQYWPLFQKSNGAFIGACGLKPWVHSTQGGHELGFHIIEEAWGKGYAPEAARAVISYAKRMGFTHLMAGHHPENENSKVILEKLGFKFLEKVLFKPTGLMHSSYRLDL